MNERFGGELLDDDAPFSEARALAKLEEVRKEIARYQAVREDVNAEFERFIQSFKKPDPLQPPARISEPSPAPAVVVRPPEPTRRSAPPPPVSLPPRASAPATVVPPPVIPPPIGPPPPRQPASARFEPLNLEPFIKDVEVPTSPEAFEAREADDEDELFAPGVDFDALPPPLDPVEEAAVVAPPPPAARPAGKRTWMVVGIIAVIAVGGYAWQLQQSSDPASVEQPAATPVKGTQPNTQKQGATRSPKASGTAPAAAGQRTTESGPRTEIVTTQRAWVRVIADGQRVVERELPAGSRIPFTATKTIQVRTGNAGAVRVTIGGVDRGALGRSGEVVSRTFTVPGPPR